MISRSKAFALKLVFSISLLVLLIWKIDGREALATLGKIHSGYMTIAICLVIIDRGMGAFRTYLLLKSSGAEIRFPEMLRFSWMCDFISHFLPGSLAGDAFRVYGISKGYSALTSAFSIVALERLSGALSLLCIAFTGGLFGFMSGLISPNQFLLLAVAFGGGAVVVGAAIVMAPFLLDSAIFRRHALLMRARSLLAAIMEFKSEKTVMSATFAISLTMQCFRVLIVMAIASGIGIDIDAIYFLILVPVGTVAATLPVSVGGWGVQEGTFVLLLQVADVPGSHAFVLSILTTLAVVMVSLPGLFFYVKSGLAKKRHKETWNP